MGRRVDDPQRIAAGERVATPFGSALVLCCQVGFYRVRFADGRIDWFGRSRIETAANVGARREVLACESPLPITAGTLKQIREGAEGFATLDPLYSRGAPAVWLAVAVEVEHGMEDEASNRECIAECPDDLPYVVP